MIETRLPLAPELWATLPAPDPGALLEELTTLRRENAALRVENVALPEENATLHQQAQVLSARLGQNSANSARPPSSDSLQAAVHPKAPPSERKRGGQPGHRGAFRPLLPVEQVDEIVAVVPERCRRCQQPFGEPAGRRHGRVWRHRVVELLQLAVRVTEYQMAMPRWEYGVLMGRCVGYHGNDPAIRTSFPKFCRITPVGLEVVADLAKRPKRTSESQLAAALIAQLRADGWDLVAINDGASPDWDRCWYFKRLVP